MQPRPMQNPNIIRIQIETLRQQRSQLARAGSLLQGVAQFDDTTPLARSGRTRLRFRVRRDEMCVVLGGHGANVLASFLFDRETLHRSSDFLSTSRRHNA